MESTASNLESIYEVTPLSKLAEAAAERAYLSSARPPRATEATAAIGFAEGARWAVERITDEDIALELFVHESGQSRGVATRIWNNHPIEHPVRRHYLRMASVASRLYREESS